MMVILTSIAKPPDYSLMIAFFMGISAFISNIIIAIYYEKIALVALLPISWFFGVVTFSSVLFNYFSYPDFLIYFFFFLQMSILLGSMVYFSTLKNDLFIDAHLFFSVLNKIYGGYYERKCSSNV